jgi:hypothetical protein
MLLCKRLFSTSLSITITILGYGQNCDCKSDFVWMKKTFEENDAGFQYVIDQKGTQAYDDHNQLFEQKVISAKKNYECAEILNEWLQFFRKGHIGIEILENDLPGNIQETIQVFPDWEKMDENTTTFKKYLDSKKDFDLEGIWQDGVYTLGIKKIDNQYIGFIIDSQAKEWEKGQIKFRIYPDSTVYYMRNRSAKKLRNVQLVSKNLLLFDDISSSRRTYPEYDDKFLNSLTNLELYLEQLNSSTLYLQIPSFHSLYVNTIDSFISEHKKKILSTENLIIDLRYNGGGSDASWDCILPIIFTNPFRQNSVNIYSTPANNQLYTFAGEEFIEKLNNNLGKFVLFDSDPYYTTKFDTVYEYPKQVAILVNKYCGSSTEQFLLTAKQSKKVKIFGTATKGSLDFSNLNSAESPDLCFRLYFATLKRVDFEDYPIDNIGIHPDYYLDRNIPEYQWVDYVRSVLDYDIKW